MPTDFEDNGEFQDQEVVEFPIEWVLPNEVVSKHANNIIVQHDESSFYLSFFETVPPIIFSEKDREETKSVKSYCVGRIVVPARKMRAFINALQSNYDKHQEKISQGAYD